MRINKKTKYSLISAILAALLTASVITQPMAVLAEEPVNSENIVSTEATEDISSIDNQTIDNNMPNDAVAQEKADNQSEEATDNVTADDTESNVATDILPEENIDKLDETNLNNEETKEVDELISEIESELEQNEDAQAVEVHSTEGGFVAPDYELDNNLGRGLMVMGTGGSSMPTSYDNRKYITSVKNQGNLGICWAFSAISCIEANLLKKDYASKDNLDLSELHLAYYAYNSAPDPLGNDVEDNSYSIGGNFLQYGGNGEMAGNCLLKQKGLTAQGSLGEDASRTYDIGYYKDKVSNVNKSEAYSHNIYRLKSYKEINGKNINEIKQAVIDYGACNINIYAIDGSVSNYSNYLNTSTYAEYYNGSGLANHAVTVVGWDDNYSIDNFASGNKPPQNGAWIVLNSWGDSWGNSGYFYLSYYDTSIHKCAYAFDAERISDGYDNNYQFDNCVSYQTGTIQRQAKVANVYKTVANAGGTEELKAVGVEVLAATNYSVQIYKNPGVNKASNKFDPETGTPMLSTPVTGRIADAGFERITIPTVTLNEGDTFAVVFDFTNGSGFVKREQSFGIENIYMSKVSSNEGQSYTYYPSVSGSYWGDNFGAGGDYAIKAYTDNVINPKEPYRVALDIPQGYRTSTVWVDGIEYKTYKNNGKYGVSLKDSNAKSVICYKYNEKNVQSGMCVYFLSYEGNSYKAIMQPELENVLNHEGFSIRVKGKSGIRYKASISINERKRLIEEGINGYKLKEYGIISMNEANRSKYPMIKDGTKTKAAVVYGYDENNNWKNFALSKTDSKYIYTAVLVGLKPEQYKTNIAFRNYAVLEKNGEKIVLYGLPATRSLYELSNNIINAGNCKKGSSEYEYLTKIINDAK